jgi:hypothetical protein
VRVIDGAAVRRGIRWRRQWAPVHVGNVGSSGGEGGNEVPTQEANGKPARAGFPPFAAISMRPYSAFMRAIIFLFAAFSFRFRRSLGFSKC